MLYKSFKSKQQINYIDWIEEKMQFHDSHGDTALLPQQGKPKGYISITNIFPQIYNVFG